MCPPHANASSTVTKTVTKNTLYYLVLEKIEGPKQTAIHLNVQEIQYFKNMILHYPELTKKMDDFLDKIVADGKIVFHDVPNLILLVSEMYKSHILENEIKNICIVSLVQITMDTLLDSDLLSLPEFELECIKKIADSSIQLLEMIPSVNLEKESCSCFSLTSYYRKQNT